MRDVGYPPTVPLVSIVVPMADDAVDGAQRLANANAQTWTHLELLTPHVRNGNFAAAVNVGILASEGTYISVLLPGTRHSPAKVARQMEFINRFELQEAVVFCNYTIHGDPGHADVVVELPSVDPSVMPSKLCTGFALEPGSLLFPRHVFDLFGPLDEAAPQTAFFEFCIRLGSQVPLVGMADQLLSVTRTDMHRSDKQPWRRAYARALSVLLDGPAGRADNDLFSALGQAASARLSEGQPLAAWDVFRAAAKRLSSTHAKSRALRSFALPLLRLVFRRLPVGIKRLVRPAAGTSVAGAVERLDFAAIYQNNGFVGTESLSGAGSTVFQTRVIRRELPLLLRRLGATSMLDIPCGDFHWMRALDLADIRYIGADVVGDMVEFNQRRFSATGREFQRVDLITGPLPTADLVFCRDCLVHLPYTDAMSAIDTVRRSACKWLLSTTFVRTDPNEELGEAGWRPLNLTLPPFNLPPPKLLILEKCTEVGGMAGDKALGLWRIADLPPFQRA